MLTYSLHTTLIHVHIFPLNSPARKSFDQRLGWAVAVPQPAMSARERANHALATDKNKHHRQQNIPIACEHTANLGKAHFTMKVVGYAGIGEHEGDILASRARNEISSLVGQ